MADEEVLPERAIVFVHGEQTVAVVHFAGLQVRHGDKVGVRFWHSSAKSLRIVVYYVSVGSYPTSCTSCYKYF